ncbi:hypothetical protein ADUPG1_003047, partial [Aduncisulcus paluster]
YLRLGVSQHKVLAARPQANGMVERANQEVIRHIRIALAMIKYKEDWERAIPMAQYVINTTVNRMTGVSPYEALFGKMWDPSRGSLLKWKDSEGKSDVKVDDIGDSELMHEYVRNLRKNVSRVHEVMREANEEATLKRDKKLAPAVDAFNRKVERRLLSGVEVRKTVEGDPAKTKLVYLPGSYVLMRPTVKPAHKFSARLLGPWLVNKHDLETETVTLTSLTDGKIRKAATDTLVPFDDSNATLEDMKDMAAMD